MTDQPNTEPKVECRECGKSFHHVIAHASKEHKLSKSEYQRKYPGAPLMSAFAEEQLAAGRLKVHETPAPPVRDPFRVGVAALEVIEEDELEEEDRPWVPKHDENWHLGTRERDQWEALALELEMGGNAMIVGPTGCGKSCSVLELASIVGQPVRRMNLHGDIRASHFVGEKLIDIDHETGQSQVVWRDGLFTQAWRRGHWILLDEIDFGPPPILAVIQAALENGGRLVLPENGGEVIDRHPRTRVIATANTLGKGDESGLYAGTTILNEAFLDRFGTVIEADYPLAPEEKKIVIAKSGVEPACAEMMVECAIKVREAFAKETAFCTLSTRRLIAWAQKTRRFRDWEKAAHVTVLNKLGPDDRKFVKGVLERVFGSTKDPAKLGSPKPSGMKPPKPSKPMTDEEVPF